MAAEQPVHPNIIVIFTDDQTFRAIGYENPEVKTPQLDALSAAGIRFRNCYVASPICAASRASMMTGQFPQQHGVTALHTPQFAPYLNKGKATAWLETSAGNSFSAMPTRSIFSTSRGIRWNSECSPASRASNGVSFRPAEGSAGT